jgi:hypothetical protein
MDASSSQTRWPPTSFTKFPKLPSELRLKIWSFATPGPRNVRIDYKVLSATLKEMKHPEFTPYTSAEPPPAIFQVCRESRAEAQKMGTHKLSFGSKFHHEARIYFDFSQDTLNLGDGTGKKPENYVLDAFIGGGWHGADDFEKVERLSIDLVEDIYDRRTFIWDEIRQFSSLKELTVHTWEHYTMMDGRHYSISFYRHTLQSVVDSHPEWEIPKVTLKSLGGEDSAILGREKGTNKTYLIVL